MRKVPRTTANVAKLRQAIVELGVDPGRESGRRADQGIAGQFDFLNHHEDLGALARSCASCAYKGSRRGPSSWDFAAYLARKRPVSPRSILRLKKDQRHDYDLWKRRDLADLELVYLSAEPNMKACR